MIEFATTATETLDASESTLRLRQLKIPIQQQNSKICQQKRFDCVTQHYWSAGLLDYAVAPSWRGPVPDLSGSFRVGPIAVGERSNTT